MATLNEIFEAHSKRISRISQKRDARLAASMGQRDRDLRSLPAAAKLYDAFDNEIAALRATQQATDAKAEAVRAAALRNAAHDLSGALAAAHDARREADVTAFQKRRRAEEAAEHEFTLAIGAGAAKPASPEAQRIRAEQLAKAKKEFDTELAAAQEQFRKSRDAALIAEGRGSREAERTYRAASGVSEASAKVARSSAEQKLATALSAIPQAQAEFAEWRQETARIVEEFRQEERAAFEQFHREVQALKS